MAIWVYSSVSRQPSSVWARSSCVFCQIGLKLLHSETDDISTVKSKGFQDKRVFVCPVCGWWKAERTQDIDDFVHHIKFRALYGAAASLRELDLSDVSTPVEDIRSFLAANYAKRGNVHPKLFEETVASGFRDHGYLAEVTAYSGDDGIDVILARGSEKIGVQVKRYKNDIEVEQIRSLAGALLLNGFTKGILITTSEFQRGAQHTVERYKTRGYQIELYDAEKLYEALHIAQRNMYRSMDEFPVADVFNRLEVIDDHAQGRYAELPFTERFY